MRIAALLLASAILLGLFAAGCARGGDNLSPLRERLATAEPAPWPDPARFAADIERFRAEDAATGPRPYALMAVGSSSMVGWHATIERDLAPLPVVKRGFGGSTMHDVLHYFDDIIAPHRPQALLVYEGDNDLWSGQSAESYAAEVLRFVDRVHALVPEARIHLLAAKPSPARWSMWPEFARANALLAEMGALDDRLVFVDIAAPMLDEDGQVRPELFLDDMLHLNAAGYEAWTPVVREALAAEIGRAAGG